MSWPQLRGIKKELEPVSHYSDDAAKNMHYAFARCMLIHGWVDDPIVRETKMLLVKKKSSKVQKTFIAMYELKGQYEIDVEGTIVAANGEWSEGTITATKREKGKEDHHIHVRFSIVWEPETKSPQFAMTEDDQ